MDWLREPSDLDRATIVLTPGGSVASVLYPGEEERARLEHRQAHEAMAAERRADELRRSAIEARVRPFLDQGPAESNAGTEGLSPARVALVRHLTWRDSARRLAGEAIMRSRTIAATAYRRSGALVKLEELDASVADARAAWIRFGSEAEAPDARAGERERLCAVLTSTEALAALADKAEFEVSVAQACIEAIEEMLPGLRNAVLIESSAPLAERIRTLAGDLERAYSLLAALRVATDGTGGVRPGRVDLPRLASGPCVVNIISEQDDVAGWQQALTDLEANPRAEIRLLQTPRVPDQPPPSLVAAARRRFRILGGPK